jgi:hypothetical protein
MKKDPDHNSTDSAEIEALITRIEMLRMIPMTSMVAPL